MLATPLRVPDQALRTRLAAVCRPLAEVEGLLVGAEILDGGTFATTYRLTFESGLRVVAKTAPTDTRRLMRYEHGILATEERVYRLAADRPELLMPRVLLSDFTRAHLDTDVLVVSHLDGVPWDTLDALSPGQHDAIVHDLGGIMAHLHRVTGPTFGYPATEALQASTWPEAFTAMTESLLDDGATWSVPLPVDRVRAAWARHHDALAEVTTPRLVHTDLWPGNVFVDPETLRITGIIDTERSFWGDPLFELAGADQLGTGPAPSALVEGCAAAGGRFDATALPVAGALAPADARLLMYRSYMYLVMTVEVAPRGFTGDWVPERLAHLAGLLDGALETLLA
ncbi:aminoglycoside phosphotransferase family protein [Sanguibacter sp. 25GB23B1]|uniref:phosphotransferase family protein n=1 Tax=unclassified Sanguibacter TaxID=2645534 RepID=UPI0032AFAF0E